MEATSSKFASVEAYLATVPQPARALLQELRNTIKKAAPDAAEVISYSMPAFRLQGMLVWYAGYKNHIGFYPKPSALEYFKKELSVYKSSKGAVQFPLTEPLPVGLITRMVKFRVAENLEAYKKKAEKNKSK